ncbi:MAG: sigma-54-dependent Fis family transcriptional regulator [Nitrospirae bacterium]|nr:sigma-54-dependent Fis family transcriptional regulator [Nitrospirota bacterium]
MKSNNKLMILDDDKAFLGMLTEVFQDEYDVVSFSDPVAALRHFREHRIDVVLTDIVMPNINGIQVLQIVRAESFSTDVIVMTAFTDVEIAVDAMKKGAYDYIVKPFTTDELSLRLKHVFDKRRLFDDNAVMKKVVEDRYRPNNMIGEGKEMKEVFRLIEAFSQIDSSVLITGESGTGKELVAKALHFSGTRKEKRFVSVNCAAIPENLLESELFGFMKGAFSGAAINKNGLFELAEGGTLFLDEIGEMSLNLQPKLLRVLEDRKIRRLGGSDDIVINARIICATNKDLYKEIKEKSFRSDLYYRINNVSIHVPALREHRDDIPFLVSHFLAGRKKIHPMALGLLSQYSWPGNVRELKSLIEQMVVLINGEIIMPADLPPEIIRITSFLDDDEQSYADAKKKLLDNFNREIVTRALLRCYGNVTNASRELGLDRGSFQKLMRKYKIISKEFKEGVEQDNSDDDM